MEKPTSVEIGSRWLNPAGEERVVKEPCEYCPEGVWFTSGTWDTKTQILASFTYLGGPPPPVQSPGKGEGWEVGQRRRGTVKYADGMGGEGGSLGEFEYAVVAAGMKPSHVKDGTWKNVKGSAWTVKGTAFNSNRSNEIFTVFESWPSTLLDTPTPVDAAPRSPHPTGVPAKEAPKAEMRCKACGILMTGRQRDFCDGDCRRSAPNPALSTRRDPIEGRGELSHGDYDLVRVGDFSALQSIQARKKPEPWIPSVTEEDCLCADAGTSWSRTLRHPKAGGGR